MGKCKKVTSVVLSVVLTLCMVLGITTQNTTVNAASSSSWNFKNSNFKSLGTISTTVTVDGLAMLATSAKTMSVIADAQTVDGTDYTYCLSLGGGGTTTYRAVKVPVSGTDTIKVVNRSTGTDTRSLIIADANGNKLGTIAATSAASVGTYSYSGASGYVYLYSSASNINLYKIQVDSTGSTSGSTSGTTSGTTSTPTDGTICTTFSQLTTAIAAAEKAGGGKVYVKGTTISCTGQIALGTINSNVQIIGIQNSDGTYPVLDFSAFRSSYIGKSTSDAQVGVRITGSYYTIKNLIIQKAPDNGIQMKGTTAGNNTVENCIVRYNNDAGVQITAGAYSNTIKYVSSYRNCDVYTLGGNADGFAPKLAAGKDNVFYGCYAWDNSDDGWDSYDKTDGLTYSITYEECATWNNGNPDVATGKYDFDNGNALDTDLPLVELIMAKDSSFATKYAQGTFSLPTGNFIVTSAGTISISSWTGTNYDGNPNGFKFGSVNSTASCVRTVKNCLAFNHASKGFDNNNSACTASMTNCISFDNGYNYYMQPFTLTKFSNILGFNGTKSDKLPSGYSATTPSTSTQSSIRSTVASTSQSIMDACDNNKIPTVLFNIY